MTETDSAGRRGGDSSRPSLLFEDGDDATLSASGSASRPAMRMLGGLDESRPDGRRPRWLVLGIAVAAVAAGAVWTVARWAGDRGESSPDMVTASPAPATVVAAPVPPPVPVVGSRSSQGMVAGSAASTAAGSDRLAVAAAEASPARIESVPSSAPERPSQAPAEPAASARLAIPTEPKARLARSSPAAPRASAKAEPPRAAERVATRSGADAPRRTAERSAGRSEADGARRTTSTASSTADPDVALLSALLTRLSSEGTAASPATLARYVEQCETRPVGSAIDALECRRRICAGHWGKAEACPAALAPRAH